jgi:hypothetical protein
MTGCRAIVHPRHAHPAYFDMTADVLSCVSRCRGRSISMSPGRSSRARSFHHVRPRDLLDYRRSHAVCLSLHHQGPLNGSYAMKSA